MCAENLRAKQLQERAGQQLRQFEREKIQRRSRT